MFGRWFGFWSSLMRVADIFKRDLCSVLPTECNLIQSYYLREQMIIGIYDSCIVHRAGNFFGIFLRYA